jgi:hypothetical protein
LFHNGEEITYGWIIWSIRFKRNRWFC